jgi:hypothetical protein
LRTKEKLLDWFEEDEGRLSDPRVAVAVRRARRALPYQRLYARLSDSLPPEFRKRVKRALAARSTIIRKRITRGRIGTSDN